MSMATTQVLLKTTQGDIQIELFEKEAPISTQNFIQYAKTGFYKNTIFHRVIPNFMIQGGGFTVNMQQKPTRSAIKNEADNGLKNERGTIAMARTGVIDSATSQFFINLGNNATLDHGVRDYGYAVFGKVSKGMDVVDKIAAQPTGRKGVHQNVPLKPIIILDAKVIKTK
ncbi:hypothetical protein GWI33_009991 [Rhynchophorus ferrugineus]|uniref:Peptidyl-prolyl cis-trans isomerase n=1 Tax=Rhynchophorus ferrugineus TaxID=354439 RepID=A0A834ICP9_RHYFE|nr:hypothetical protein GWI33_009991 [Rhynchophorus ferrugineus]